ncbi:MULTISPECIES: ArsC family reductase [Edwardsiella]|nr:MULTISPECIES: ArsC family reductase [Edwardsiella]AKM49006.1 ArsC family transcriptional regulator [Edwardsiella sp. EA181011]GAJ66389.1 ArsC family protein [Edwardsiella piscicida]RFT02031.1 arsenate reductase [Edwardsiella anguillarum]UBU94924.1 ArsC family reductase [Edwardsiella sp. LADL05-105]UOU80006.1 ArsC family reductase [Edwardsiella anguillarum]
MTTLSSSPMPVIYGIKNCDTVKKARRWLDERQIPYRFHDYRSDGLDEARLNGFIEQLGVGALLNTRGTTWRGLDEATRAEAAQPEAAARLMLASPVLIKRPLLQWGEQLLLGFTPERYAQFFAEEAQ